MEKSYPRLVVRKRDFGQYTLDRDLPWGVYEVFSPADRGGDRTALSLCSTFEVACEAAAHVIRVRSKQSVSRGRLRRTLREES